MYDSANYANTRLCGCYIWDTKAGRLFFVRECYEGDNGIVINGSYVGDRNNSDVPISSFDFSFPRLGFVYDQGMCCYLMKYPLRRDWRQGLRSSNYTALVFSMNNNEPGVKTNRLDTRRVSKFALQKCVAGFKMDLDEAMEECYNNETCVPLNRHFYIGPTQDVNHFHLGYTYTGLCGDLRNGEAKMFEGKEFLNEAYERSVQNAA